MEFVQDIFFYGLSDENGTKPGFALENETFLLRFEGGMKMKKKIQSENQVRFIKGRFEFVHDWKQIMEKILASLEYFFQLYQNLGDFHKHCTLRIRAWLSEFQENVVETNLAMFEELADLYEISQSPLSDLVDVEVMLEHIVGDPEVCERRKMLRVKFLSQRYRLVANFTLEKKKLRRTLAEHAAGVVARMVNNDTEKVKELKIPPTLKSFVTDQIIDAQFLATHWGIFRMSDLMINDNDQDDADEEDEDELADSEDNDEEMLSESD